MTDWPNIISVHEAMLWRTVYRVLNHRDDALDCCQEALLDAYKYAMNHEVEDWGALLTSLATRRAIDRSIAATHPVAADNCVVEWRG